MKPRAEIMVDLETLGTYGDCPVIMLAWVVFKLDSNEWAEKKIYIKHAQANVDFRTLQWWLDTDVKLFQDILDKGQMDEYPAFKVFVDYVTNLKKDYDVYLWGNGILFDNHIIKTKCIKYGLNYPIDYDKDRDVRTLVDLYCTKFGVSKATLKEQFKPAHEHDALDDCKAQIVMVKHMYGGMINEKTT